MGELRAIVEELQKDGLEWIDQNEEVAMSLYNDEEEEGKDAGHELSSLGTSWRSDPETKEHRLWMKVDSVVDSGASAPVAPPSMAPNVSIEPSEGSKRGQKWTSASKHKLKTLGQ